MSDVIKTDICVIGAGAAGLTVAAGASQMGARVVLIEKGLMGGDCLNYGCVPSKALLAAAHAAQTIREAGRFGITAGKPKIDPAAVRDHVRGVIAGIAPMDSQERFEAMGVQVIRAEARFTGPREVVADGKHIRARRFVIATGSTPDVPAIPGIDTVPYMTNETIFDLDTSPEHLIVIGGGPIGAELAQAHRRLGARVTMLVRSRLLARDDHEAADVVARRLVAEGVEILTGVAPTGVEHGAAGIAVTVLREDGESQTVDGSHLLIATGRKPSVDGLNLKAAEVASSSLGVTVDQRLRTSNKRIFAIGDVSGGPQFTHVAGYHGGIVIRNALLHLPAKVNHDAVPWVTYTDPELAHVGRIDLHVREKLDDGMSVLRWSFAENDRARAERNTDGFAKVVTDKKGRVLGATIVGPRAGELILPWVFAVARKEKIGAMAGIMVPYPTLSEVSKRAAGSYYTAKLFGARMRRIVRILQWF